MEETMTARSKTRGVGRRTWQLLLSLLWACGGAGADEALVADDRVELGAVLSASLDTYVDSAYPNTSFSSKTTIQADSSPSVKRGLLRFSFATIAAGTITSAKLRLFVQDASSRSGSLSAVEGDWSAGTTWGTAPAIGDKIADFPDPATAGTWREADVTAYVRAGRHDFYLTTGSSDGVDYRSAEATSNRPELLITFTDLTDAGAPPADAGIGPVPDAGTSPSDGGVAPKPDAGSGPDGGTQPDAGQGPGLDGGLRPPQHRIYAFYYLWWSSNHWTTKLGPNFPYGSNPWPLPAILDPEGCSPINLYPGNMLTDSPAQRYGQDDPQVIERHVRLAASAGLAGFIVNWIGEGTTNQTPDTNSNNRRLQEVINAVHKVNAEGIPFKLWLSLKASASIRTEVSLINDLAYLARQYGSDSAWDHHYSPRIMTIWQGSRKYNVTTIQNVSTVHRGTFFFLGDEKDSWGDGRAAFLDGNTYYWSTQNPYTNPSSFGQIQDLARQVRAAPVNPDGSRKLWFAPLAPGYNSVLNGGSTCVKRDDGTNRGATLRTLFKGNQASSPDGWTFISWNEIAEGTHVEPLQRWGTFYLDRLAEVIRTP